MTVLHPAASRPRRAPGAVSDRPLLSAFQAGVAAFRTDWRRSRAPGSMVLIDLDGCGVKAEQVPDVVSLLRGIAGRRALIFAAGSDSTRGHQRACHEAGVAVLPSGRERNAADNALLARAQAELADRDVATYIVSRDGGFCRLLHDYTLVLFGDAEQASRRLRDQASTVVVVDRVPA